MESDSSQGEKFEKRDELRTRKPESDIDDVGFGDDMDGFAIDLNDSGYLSNRGGNRERDSLIKKIKTPEINSIYKAVIKSTTSFGSFARVDYTKCTKRIRFQSFPLMV